jgi:MSHA biogenesis protein MshJ
MSLNASLINMGSRFNAMSLRERAMIAAALLALLIVLWDQVLMGPLRLRETQLSQEVEEVKKNLEALATSIEGRANDNPLSIAMTQKKELTQSLASVDAQLQSESAGLIAPQRMLAALRDVLERQQGLRLVSMRNLPVTSLLPPPVNPNAGVANPVIEKSAAYMGVPNAEVRPAIAESGPYIHSLEIVVEGNYLDVLRYLQTVEQLPWRFYWQVLELKTTEYPTNRVRLRLNTLSMEKEWLGV